MHTPFTMDDLVSRNMNPEKLETLSQVFDAVSEESAMPAERRGQDYVQQKLDLIGHSWPQGRQTGKKPLVPIC